MANNDLDNSIFSRLFRRRNRASNIIFTGPPNSKSAAGRTVSVFNALENTTVLSCVNVISQTIAQLPWDIQRRTPLGYETVENHSLSRILRQPNSFQSGYQFKAGILVDLLVHGNAYIRIQRAGVQVLDLIPMEPSKMKVSSNDAGFPIYTHESYEGDMTNEDVIHIKDIAGHNITATSRVVLASERVGALNAADFLISETFKYGITLNYAIEIDGSLDENKLIKLQQQLGEAFGSGGIRRGGAAILENGKITAIKGTTPADADIRNLRDQLIREICGLMRVPASMAGGMGDEKYNNVTAKYASFYRDTINPLVINIEEAISSKLLSSNETVKFDISLLIKGDTASQIDYVTKARQAGVMTQNEGRIYLGWTPLEGEGYDELSQSAPTPGPEGDMNPDGSDEGSDAGNLGDAENGTN